MSLLVHMRLIALMKAEKQIITLFSKIIAKNYCLSIVSSELITQRHGSADISFANLTPLHIL